jgi:hypothetical protein
MISSRFPPHKEASLGTGAKIAIGCGIAVVVAGVVTLVALGGLAFWVTGKAKGKVEELTGEQRRIEELQRRANANRFTPPADGVISEDRLQKFLGVRKRVYGIYETHQAELDALGQKKETDFGDVRRGFNLINELRLAQAQALADAGMSEDEYRFLAEQVYKTMWAEPNKPTDVPPANLALFRKYEADIKKYAMSGLEWIAL